jgi:hypothetical protein
VIRPTGRTQAVAQDPDDLRPRGVDIDFRFAPGSRNALRSRAADPEKVVSKVRADFTFAELEGGQDVYFAQADSRGLDTFRTETLECGHAPDSQKYLPPQ